MDYIRAEHKLHSISKLLISQVITLHDAFFFSFLFFFFFFFFSLFMVQEDLEKERMLNEMGRLKSRRQNSCWQAKRANLYSDLLHAEKREP